MGEFSLIDEIKSRFQVPQGMLGIGDDCAVIPQNSDMDTLVSTDMLMEGVHFLIDDVDPFDLGWKSAAVNISDIAGMGGKPVATFLSFALPKSLDEQWRHRFIDGYKALSDKFDCPLLGGDTTSSLDRLCISVTVLGECNKGCALRRDAAMPGDIICVTGNLGDSAAGLRIILDAASASRGDCASASRGDCASASRGDCASASRGDCASASRGDGASTAQSDAERSEIERTDAERSEIERTLVDRHYRPMPQIAAGQLLASVVGVHACMDISDGVASDLRHILKASGVGAEVTVGMLPLSDELRAYCSASAGNISAERDILSFALEGGEDYQLLFTATNEVLAHLREAGLSFTSIGVIDSSNSLKWRGTDRDFLGFRHF